MTKHKLSRRGFIGQSCAAVGYTTLFSSLINLKAMASAAMASSAPPNNYKALVCFMLSGGNDSYNMLMPRNGQAYNDYSITRSNLAIPSGEILPITPNNPLGQDYGIHPSMPELQQLFETNKLSFVANVGALMEPTSKPQFYSGSHPLPLGLFSHSDQVQHWHTGKPGERSGFGWGGRMADLISSMNTNENISMNISLSGTNTFQQGTDNVEYVIDQNGAVGINGYGGDWLYYQLRKQAIDNMLDQEYADIYKNTYVNTVRNSKDATIEFQEAVEQVPEFATQFSDNPISQRFRMVAKTIAAREALGFCRQTFFVDFSGFDNHDELLNAHANRMEIVSIALSEFNAVLEELGVSNDVTTFTISDFARTLTSNGNGTDHAWGGNMMVMGGSVNGGEIYGQYPSLELDNPLELGGGVLIPTTSAAEYMAELARWFGVEGSSLDDIFPNLVNFYNSASPDMPIGFMNA